MSITARTNERAVGDLIPTERKNIYSAIRTANLLVTNELSDSGLSDNMLEIIERYLSAHFLCMNPKIRSELGLKLDEYKTGLDKTEYGQMAMRFDNTNTLKNVSKKKDFQFRVF